MAYILCFVLGGMLGVSIMCILQINRDNSIYQQFKFLRESLEQIAGDIPVSRQNTPISYLQGIAQKALVKARSTE